MSAMSDPERCDPALEAARRAWRAQFGSKPLGDDNYTIRVRTLAAREALQPIRDRHRPFTRDYPGGDGRTVCNHCLGPVDWPCLDARDAYSAEEIAERTRRPSPPVCDYCPHPKHNGLCLVRTDPPEIGQARCACNAGWKPKAATDA